MFQMFHSALAQALLSLLCMPNTTFPSRPTSYFIAAMETSFDPSSWMKPLSPVNFRSMLSAHSLCHVPYMAAILCESFIIFIGLQAP